MKKRAFAVLAVLLIAIALDVRRPPSAQWSAAAAVGSIHLYQATLSPLYANLGVHCRFTPTCSHYGEEAIRKHGFARGGYLAAKRVLRCGPWTPRGAIDNAPSNQGAGFRVPCSRLGSVGSVVLLRNLQPNRTKLGTRNSEPGTGSEVQGSKSL